MGLETIGIPVVTLLQWIGGALISAFIALAGFIIWVFLDNRYSHRHLHGKIDSHHEKISEKIDTMKEDVTEQHGELAKSIDKLWRRLIDRCYEEDEE